MGAVFQLSEGKERFIVAPYELLAVLPPRLKFDEEKLGVTMHALELDDYFELVESDRKGERVFVIIMHEKGLAYKRSDAQRRRKMYFKIAATVLCGALSAIVGILIKMLLS